MHTYIMHTYVHTYIHSYIHTFIHSYIHTFIHSYIHTFIHSYIHTSIHSYIHTFIHSYIHTSIHSYIHTFIHSCIAYPSNDSIKIIIAGVSGTHQLAPAYLMDLVVPYVRSLRSADQNVLTVKRYTIERHARRSFSVTGLFLWNALPSAISNSIRNSIYLSTCFQVQTQNSPFSRGVYHSAVVVLY